MADNYVFQEKVRHPTKEGDWITMRDCVTAAERSDIYYKPQVTATVTQFTLDTYSYNYTKSNSQWVNNIDKINNYSVTIPDVDSQLITDLEFESSYTLTTPPTGVVKDITNTYDDVSIKYDTNSISIIEGENDNFNWITQITDNQNLSNHNVAINNNDTIVVPSFTNGTLSLTGYQFSTSPTTDVYPAIKESFNSNDYVGQTDVLNIIKDSENTINLTDMWNTYCISVYVLEFEDGKITVAQDVNGTGIFDSTNLNSNLLYGNGVIFNRYGKESTVLNINFDYQWIAVHDTNFNNYIIKLQYDTSETNPYYKIVNGYQVEIKPNDDILNLKVINAISNNYSGFLYSDWNTSIQWTQYPSFLVPDIYFVDTDVWGNTFARKNYKTNADLKEIVIALINKDNLNNSNFIRSDTNRIGQDSTINMDININGVKFSTNNIWTIIENSEYYYSINGKNISASDATYIQFEINNQNQILFSLHGMPYTIFTLWWDAIINSQSITPIADINLQFLLTEVIGELNYNDTSINRNNYYELTYQWTITNVNYGQDITQLWNNILITTKSNTTPNLGQILLTYDFSNNSNLQVYQSATNTTTNLVSQPCMNKIWLSNFNLSWVTTTNNNIIWISKDKQIIHDSFWLLAVDDYTKMQVIINIPEEQELRTITYTKHEWQYSMRYYGGDNKLLNVGNINTPVYIKDGQFYPCTGLKDILIAADTDENTYAGETLWIDTDA